MADVAQLGIAVDSSQAKSATGDLKGLAAAANSAEQASSKLSQAGQKSESALRAMDAAAKRAGVSTEEMQRRTEAFNATTTKMAGASLTAQKALVTLSTQAKTTANDNQELGKKTENTTSSLEKFAARFTRGLIAGAAIAGVRELIQYLVQLNSQLAATADTATRTGIGGQQYQGLQTAAGYKGIKNDTFDSAMLSFNTQVDLAKRGLGDLYPLLQRNGKVASDTASTFTTVADMVKNAGTESEKFSLLQQAGLPATREFAKLMEQGASSIQKQADAAKKVSNQQLEDAKRIDEEWQKLVVNFENGAKRIAVNIAGAFGGLTGTAASLGLQGRQALRNGQGTQLTEESANDFYSKVGLGSPARVAITGGQKTFNPQLDSMDRERQNAILAQLGQVATLQDVLKQKENELEIARNRGLGVSEKQQKAIMAVTQAQFEQYRVQQQASLGIFDFAKAQKAANDNLQALVAQKLLDPSNVQQWAAATTVAAKSLEQLRDQAALAAAPLESLKRLELEGSNLRGLTDNAAVSSLNGLSSSLLDITSGTKSAADGFKNLGTTVVRALQEMIIKMTIITPIARGLQSLLGGFVGGGTVSGAVGPTSLGGLPLSFAAADGGTFGAGWGVVGERGPELINVHSGGVTVVPNHISKPYLPGFADGGTLSAAGNVTSMPFGQNNTPKITINNYTDAQPSTETAPNGDITITLKKMVNGMIVDSIANGDGGRTISQKFGVKPFAGQ